MDNETKDKVGALVKSTEHLHKTLQRVGPQLIIEHNRELIKKIKEEAFFQGFLWGFLTTFVFSFIFIAILIA